MHHCSKYRPKTRGARFWRFYICPLFRGERRWFLRQGVFISLCHTPCGPLKL